MEYLMIPVIIGLSEVIKRTDIVPVKYIPILNLIFGVFVAALIYGGGIENILLQGVIAGLTASGLYSGTKNVIQGMRNGHG